MNKKEQKKNRTKFLAFDLSTLSDTPDIPPWEEVRRQILSKLTDDQLAAILSVPGLNLATLFDNLYTYWYGRWDDEPRLEWPQALLGYLQDLAVAINNPDAKTECLGRLRDSWFKPHLWVQEGSLHWTGKYMKSLLGDDTFQVQYEDIQKSWPPELNEFRNMAIPQWLVHILNPTSLAETYFSETLAGEFPRFECDADFLKKARTFVRQWNLEEISFRDGKWNLVPAKVCCASDVDGQGTYVFIPRYYNWSRVRDDLHNDFEHVKAMLDKSFKRFKPPKRKTVKELSEECLEYVLSKINLKQWTEKQVEDSVKEWCGKTVGTKTVDVWTDGKLGRKEVPVPRYEDPDRIEKFTNYVLKEIRKITQ